MLADYAAAHGLSLEESVAYADSASDLAMLEAVGFPVAVNPESRLVGHRPAARAGTWSTGPRQRVDRTARCPLGPFDVRAAQGGDGPVSTLLFERSLPRFAAARWRRRSARAAAPASGRLRLVERDAPAVPGDGWVHVDPVLSGICGSDLATLDGRSSRYFEDIVSFPFVPGHEVVGTLAADALGADGSALAAGSRVVLQPVLGCAARGIDPLCPACQAGDVGNCGRLAFGHIRPGLQTGFCADTGGGWSASGLVAHSSQLYAVPEELSGRRCGHGRARGLRGARRAGGAASRRGTWWPSSARARWGCS